MEMRQNTVIAKNYKLISKLGRGAFGEIWRAFHTNTKEEVAIKFEDASSKRQHLYFECKTYLYMQWDNTKVREVPKMLHYGIEDKVNVMVLELLGESIEGLFSVCGKKFSLKTVLMLAY